MLEVRWFLYELASMHNLLLLPVWTVENIYLQTTLTKHSSVRLLALIVTRDVLLVSNNHWMFNAVPHIIVD